MWNDFIENTGAFPKMNKMQKHYIEGTCGTQLVARLNVFSTYMLIQSKTVLYNQKKLCWSPEFTSKTFGTFCVTLEGKNMFLPVRY